MFAKEVKARAGWAIRAIAIAGLLGLMLVGLSQAAWAASIAVDPTSGPPSTAVEITGAGFGGSPCGVTVSFTDADGIKTGLGHAGVDSGGGFSLSAQVPSSAANGRGKLQATEFVPYPPHDPLAHCIKLVASASTTFTVTRDTGTQLLGNPGFENGSSNPAPWVSTARINDTSTEPPHSGSWDAWLGGTGTTHSDSLYQDVAIPAGVASATLTFWLHIDTADTGASVHDQMKLQARNPSNAVLATLASYSNLNAAPGYVQQALDLTSYAGQTIRLYVASREDASLQTSFVVDDFALTMP